MNWKNVPYGEISPISRPEDNEIWMSSRASLRSGNERVRMESMLIILDASGMDMMALDKDK